MSKPLKGLKLKVRIYLQIFHSFGEKRIFSSHSDCDATSEIELFLRLFNRFKPLTNVTKNSISDGARVLDRPLWVRNNLIVAFKKYNAGEISHYFYFLDSAFITATIL